MKYTVAAGHGGTDPGNTSGGQRESALMDDLGARIAAHLRALGHQVLEDGPRGQNWPLHEAVKLIAGCDLAIELHTNASSNQQANGVEVIAQPQHRIVAQRIAYGISSTLGIALRRDQGWYDPEEHRRDRRWVSQALFVRSGGIIIETFFQSNPVELNAYLNRRRQVATAIADAMR